VEALVEGPSKKNKAELFGRTSANKVVVFPDRNFQKGEIVSVKVIDCTQTTLIAELVNESN